MSQLKTKNGIKCDLCGATHINQFVYYDCTCHLYSINYVNKPPIKSELDLKSNNVIKSFDMCSICYDKYRDLILKHIKDAKSGHIKDDFSDNFYDNTTLLQINLTKVTVDLTSKHMSTNIDIDINIAGESVKDFVKLLILQANKKEDEWTTS